MGLKHSIKQLLVKLIEPVLKQIEFNRNQARQKQLTDAAVFNPAKVQVGQIARIENNSGNRSLINIGDDCWMMGQLVIFRHGGQINIGKECFIGESTRIWSSAKITIGNNVLISHNVNIHDNPSHSLIAAERREEFACIRAGQLPAKMDIKEAEIVISDDVWIGFNCTILKGVTIGEGAIIGANTLITKDVPPYAVVVGNPPQIIRYTN